MKIWKSLESTFVYGLLYGLLLGSHTTSESWLYPSGVKHWQCYFESLPDDGENYRNWLPYLIAYALVVDLLHEDVKGSSTSSDSSNKDQQSTSKKKQSKKYFKSHENIPPPAPAYQPPAVVETEPDFLLNDEDEDQHRRVFQEQGHIDRKRRRETHTDGHKPKRYKLTAPNSDGLKANFNTSKVKRRKPKKRMPIRFPENCSQRLPGNGGKLKGRLRQHWNKLSDSTLMRNALHSFQVHYSVTQYEVAKKHLRTCQRMCHRLKSDGDVSVCYYYLGKLALEKHFYSKATRFFKKGIDKYSPAHILEQHQPSLSALHTSMHRSYAFNQHNTSTHCSHDTYEQAPDTGELSVHTHEENSDECNGFENSDVANDTSKEETFEKAEEEQGDVSETCYMCIESYVEVTSMCPALKPFNEFPSFDKPLLVNDNNVCVEEPDQLRRPDYRVSRDMPNEFKPFIAQYGESLQFRGISVHTTKGSTLILAIHRVHHQPRCCQSPSELLQYSQLIATQCKMQNHSSTSESAIPTIHLVFMADTLYVWFILPDQDHLQLHLKGCSFNQVLDHLQSGVSLRPHIQGIPPQTIVPNPVLSLPLPTPSCATFTISSDSAICVVGNSAASQVKVGKGDSIYLGALPSTKTEARGVAYILRTQPLLDEQANKTAVLSLMEKSVITHIAAHGMVHHGCFAIILDPGKVSCDSVLTSHDIEKLNLSAALVVLSCCGSGRGTVKADGIQGMARAFIEAGAQCVLTTQSEVPDKSASVFMQFFYWYLYHGLSSFEALERAKSSMRFSPKYSENIHWGRYKIHGKDVIMQWEADQMLPLVSQLGSRSAFPCLQIMHDMEKALVNQFSFPTAVQILCGSVPEAVTKQVAVDFICTYHHHFKGGVHRISCSGQSLKDVSKMTLKVAQVLVIADRVYESTDFTDILRNSNVHLLLLVSPSSLETAKRIIQCIRDVQVHMVKPLSHTQLQQQTIANDHLNKRWH